MIQEGRPHAKPKTDKGSGKAPLLENREKWGTRGGKAHGAGFRDSHTFAKSAKGWGSHLLGWCKLRAKAAGEGARPTQDQLVACWAAAASLIRAAGCQSVSLYHLKMWPSGPMTAVLREWLSTTPSFSMAKPKKLAMAGRSAALGTANSQCWNSDALLLPETEKA